MVELWFVFFLFVGYLNVNLGFVLGPWAFTHEIVNLCVVKLVSYAHFDIVLLHEIKEDFFAWNPLLWMLARCVPRGAFAFFADPQTDNTRIIWKNINGHVNEWPVNWTDNWSSVCRLLCHSLCGQPHVATLWAVKTGWFQLFFNLPILLFHTHLILSDLFDFWAFISEISFEHDHLKHVIQMVGFIHNVFFGNVLKVKLG